MTVPLRARVKLEEKSHERLDTGTTGAGVIRRRRPWEQPSGPKTTQGKAKASRNAYKGGTRAMLRELARLLRSRVKH
ncbi:MAG: hypothetical protein ACREX9_05860 [Gammaproteobacteria bacterium]